MQRRSFLLLLGATIVLVGGAVVTLRSGPNYVSEAPPGERALPKLAPNLGSLAWVRVTHGKTVVNFVETGGRWVVVDKGNYPAAGAKVRRMLLALADLSLVEPKTRLPALYPRLDVDDPANGRSTEVVIQDRAGQVVGRLIIGKRRPDRLGIGDDGTYVRRVGEDRAWLARGTVDLPGDAVDWLDRRILDIPAGDIATMVLRGARGDVLVIGRHAMTDRFALYDTASGVKPKSDAAVAAPAAALDALDLDDVKPAAALPVPESATATAAFRTFGGLVVHVKLFASDKRDWVSITASGTGKAAAEAKSIDARVGGWVYAIAPDRAKILRTTLADLVEPAKGS